MTALSHLSLTASSISLTAGVKLPPRLTSLQFVVTGPTVALPRQVLDLSRLVKLCLGQVLVADELPALGPTATDLSFIQCTGPAWLAKNTQLQRLRLACQTVQSAEVDSGLSALLQLTCLVLDTKTAPIKVLSRLTNLHKLYVACDFGTTYGLWEMLHPCTWLANLRWLCASVLQIALCSHALGPASSLHRMSLFHSAAEASSPESLAKIAELGCFGVLYSTYWYPRLERVDLIVRPGAPALPDFIHSGLLELQRKRPSLLIARVEQGCAFPLGFID
ncbi:hypothetical protein D9Q98_009815 [Chlorella vulgaris]|uniref:Uncharacterized protein n=1 Tax=Chlorella vulgaris TaxID=3077 RepID=A0A9D4YSL1_CHLVU|nr:hypothetical protein D9Q98_009815 [Chlorella vulgaris]